MPNLANVQKILQSCQKISVLTGAGCSTKSGLRDYRGPDGAYVRNPSFKPVNYLSFVQSEKMRKRYWARATVGWEKMSSHQPNECHNAIARLQQLNRIKSLITQNVDGLHSKAGSKDVIELHGSLHQVVCLNCKTKFPRNWWHANLTALNRASSTLEILQSNADGDVELSADAYEAFCVPNCENCKVGIIKPDVVLFGENIEPIVAKRAMDAVKTSDCLLVAGTTLSTWSALRLVLAALDLNYLPKTKSDDIKVNPHTSVIVINKGETRADTLPIIKIEDCVEDFMLRIEAELLKK